MTGSESPGGCPDADTYARMLGGSLGAAERAALERHVDRCADCTELLTELGKIYGRPATLPPDAGEPAPGAVGPLQATPATVPAALVLLLGGVGAVAWLALPSALGALAAGGGPAHFATWAAALVLYAAVIGPLGVVVGLPTAFAAWRGRAWAAAFTRVLLWLAVPTVVLAPFALLSLLVVGPPGDSPRPEP